MLNKSGKNGQPCLAPDLRGKVFCFSPLSMILAVSLSYMLFIILMYVASVFYLLRVFLMNRCWILSNVFSANIELIIWFLLFILLIWGILFFNFVYWNFLRFQGGIPLDHDVWLFWCVLKFSLQDFVENFCIYAHQR